MDAPVSIDSDPQAQAVAAAALKRAVSIFGSQSEMARRIGVKQPSVWRWIKKDKWLPAEYVRAVELATGVSKHELRPDLFPREAQLARPAASTDRLEGFTA